MDDYFSPLAGCLASSALWKVFCGYKAFISLQTISLCSVNQVCGTFHQQSLMVMFWRVTTELTIAYDVWWSMGFLILSLWCLTNRYIVTSYRTMHFKHIHMEVAMLLHRFPNDLSKDFGDIYSSLYSLICPVLWFPTIP